MAAAQTWLASYEDATNTDAYSFASVDFGAAATDRYIAVNVVFRKGGAATTIASATIGGVSATIAVEQSTAASNNNISAILIAAVPTGTTGTVAVTFNASGVSCAIDVFRVTGIDGATPHATDMSTDDDPSLSLNVPANGIVIGGSCTVVGTNTASWTGITERSDDLIESLFYSSASDDFVSAQTPLAITLTWSDASNTQTPSVAASWSPAAGGGATPHGVFGLPLHGPFAGPFG